MMQLLENVVVRCHECSQVIEVNKDDIDFYDTVYNRGKYGMGDEVDYCYDACIKCTICGNPISFKIVGCEYPIDAFDSEYSEIIGGTFEIEPHMGIIYSCDEFDPCCAYAEYNRVKQIIMEIANNRDFIYAISPRDFEEVIGQLFQDEGFETKLTQRTRDGGRDIIATKYEMGKPIVFYIECKRYGQKNSVGVNIVRSLYGVQTSDRINKAILVTTGHVTRDARKFVDDQNTLMSVIDVGEIQNLIEKSASKYRGGIH